MWHGFPFFQVWLCQTMKTAHKVMFKVVIGCLYHSNLYLLIFFFVLIRHFCSVLQNWAGMRCPYKLLRMILALVCSKLSSLTRHPSITRQSWPAFLLVKPRASTSRRAPLFLKRLSGGTVHLVSPHEGRCCVTFISKQYVPSICAGPAASELSEQPVSSGKSYFSSRFCIQGICAFLKWNGTHC